MFRAFQLFPQPFNLIADSAYVTNIVKRIEGSVLKMIVIIPCNIAFHVFIQFYNTKLTNILFLTLRLIPRFQDI